MDQVEGALQEDRHLRAGHGVGGAVVAAAAAAGDAFRSQLFDPCRAEGADGDVTEDAGFRGRDMAAVILGAQEEDRHLGAGDRVVGTVVPASAPAGDTLLGKLFDPCRSEGVGWDICKDRAGGGGRRVG